MEYILISILAVIILVVAGNQVIQNHKIKSTERNIESLTVKSEHTGYEYRAVKYRVTNDGPELKIFNYFTGRYEWWPIWNFKHAIVLLCMLDPKHALQRYGVSKKDLTKGPKKNYNKSVKK